MKYNPFHHLPEIPMGPSAARSLLAYEEGEHSYTVNFMKSKAGAGSPQHSHPHKQVVYMLSGKGNFHCGDEIQTLLPGDVVQVDPNVPHAFGSFDEDSTWLEFFTPFREDFKPEQRG